MISFHREVMNLRAKKPAENLAGEIRRALGRIRINGAPVKRNSGFYCARIVRAAFEDIHSMPDALRDLNLYPFGHLALNQPSIKPNKRSHSQSC
jgi:hypothetical protein